VLVGQVCTDCSALKKKVKMRGKEEGTTEWMRLDKPCGRCKSCMDEAAARGGEVSVRLRWDVEEVGGGCQCSTNVAVSVSGFC